MPVHYVEQLLGPSVLNRGIRNRLADALAKQRELPLSRKQHGAFCHLS